MAALDFTIVRLLQFVVAFHNFASTLQHFCRADEVELLRRAPSVGSWSSLRRVRRRPPNFSASAIERGAIGSPNTARLPLCGL